MAILRCEICGGTLEIKEGASVVVCPFCGTKQTIPQNNFNISSGNIDMLLKRAYMACEDGDFAKADVFAEKILDINIEHAEAYIVKLLAECKVRKLDGLRTYNTVIKSKQNFQRAYKYANPTIKTQLTSISKENIEYINYDPIYNKAKDYIANAWYSDAIDLLKKIPNYKNSSALKKQAETYLLEQTHRIEEKRIADKKAVKKHKIIIISITSIICASIAFIILLTTVIIPSNKYNAAMKLYTAGKYDEAITAFEALDDYKDSKTQIEKCKIAIKDEKYNAAIRLYNAGNIIEAYEALIAMNGYRDSAEKANSIYNKYKTEKIKIANIGDYIYFGEYEQDNDTSNGKEDICWIVLAKENNQILVISEKALDCKKYHTTDTSVTWETCFIRGWLNETFFNSAFSIDDQAQVKNTTVSADKNPKYTTSAGNSTTDKIFLLSIAEVNKYFTSDGARMCVPTAYAKANGARPNNSYTKGDEAVSWWWLRSPGGSQRNAVGITYYGSIYNLGICVDDNAIGVRPAMWIALNT